MKTLKHLFVGACMIYTSGCGLVNLSSCAPTPAPKPAPVTPSQYIIMEFSPAGTVSRTWQVKTYNETQFPRSVSFSDSTGKVITLTGSYEIDEVR